MSILVRASSLRGYDVLMRQLGADPAPMLRRYRIGQQALQVEDAMLPLRTVTSLLEASATLTGCQDFGLRLARGQDITVLGPLAVAMQNAATVADALGYASRYLSIQSPGLVLSVHPRSPVGRQTVELRVEVRLPHQSSQRQVIDLSLADLHHMVKLLAGSAYRLRSVTLPHAMLAPSNAYSRFFDAPVLAEQPFAGLHVAEATLAAKVATVNASLRKIAIDYLAMHAAAPDRSLTSLIRQTVQQTLGTGLGNRKAVADLVGVHPRTLQRHLANAGTSFDAIHDNVRKEMALRYLRETRIPLSQIATMLGLSEQSALTRACHRWFGAAPSGLRGTSRLPPRPRSSRSL